MTTATPATLIAYHGQAHLKIDTIGMMRKHREADKLVQGSYGDGDPAAEDFKGCAVGCMTGGRRHGEYPTRWGIPRVLAHLEDSIFEGLDNGDSQHWPEAFLEAIPVGADLSMVWPRFAVWLLSTDGPMSNALKRGSERVRTAVAAVCALYEEWITTGIKPVRQRWCDARAAAYAYAYAYAAYAAAAAAAAYDAYAADAAAAAAYDAAAAYAAAAAYDAYDAAYAAARQKFWQAARDKMLELLRAAPIPELAASA